MGKPRIEIRALTGVRAFAAWWVVLFHLSVRSDDAFHRFAPDAAPFVRFVTSTGELGVDLFFMLSGFIIAYTYADTFRARVSPGGYLRFLWLRLARIYPVHLFTLLVPLVLFPIATGLLGVRPQEGFELWGPADFLSLFLVYGWVPVGDTPFNYPSWSIDAEWFAYLTFPLSLWLATRARTRFAAALAVLGALGAMTAVLAFAGVPAETSALVRVSAEFTAGCLLFRLYALDFGRHAPWHLLTPAAFGAGVGGSVVLLQSGLSMLLATPLLALALYGLARERDGLSRMFASGPWVFWGKVSYSLYMTHAITDFALQKLLPMVPVLGTARVGMPGLVTMTLYVVAIGLVAIATYRWVEEPSRWALRRLLPGAARAPAAGAVRSD